jgi:hypothetical protein
MLYPSPNDHKQSNINKFNLTQNNETRKSMDAKMEKFKEMRRRQEEIAAIQKASADKAAQEAADKVAAEKATADNAAQEAADKMAVDNAAAAAEETRLADITAAIAFNKQQDAEAIALKNQQEAEAKALKEQQDAAQSDQATILQNKQVTLELKQKQDADAIAKETADINAASEAESSAAMAAEASAAEAEAEASKTAAETEASAISIAAAAEVKAAKAKAAFDPFANAGPNNANNTGPIDATNTRSIASPSEDDSRTSNGSTVIIAVSLLAGIVLLILAAVALYKYRKPKSKRFFPAKSPTTKPKFTMPSFPSAKKQQKIKIKIQGNTQPDEFHYTESHFSHQPSPSVSNSNFTVHSFASPKMPSLAAPTDLSSEASARSSRGSSEVTVLDPRKSNYAQAPPAPAISRMTIDPQTRVNQIYGSDLQSQRDTYLEDSQLNRSFTVKSDEKPTGPSFLQQDPKTNRRNTQRTTLRGSTWSRWSKI